MKFINRERDGEKQSKSQATNEGDIEFRCLSIDNQIKRRESQQNSKYIQLLIRVSVSSMREREMQGREKNCRKSKVMQEVEEHNLENDAYVLDTDRDFCFKLIPRFSQKIVIYALFEVIFNQISHFDNLQNLDGNIKVLVQYLIPVICL